MAEEEHRQLPRRAGHIHPDAAAAASPRTAHAGDPRGRGQVGAEPFVDQPTQGYLGGLHVSLLDLAGSRIKR